MQSPSLRSKLLTALPLAVAVAVTMLCITGAQAIPTTPAVRGDEAYGLCQTGTWIVCISSNLKFHRY